MLFRTHSFWPCPWIYTATMAGHLLLTHPAPGATYICTDLNPKGFLESYGTAISGGTTVGCGTGSATQARQHAVLWAGTNIVDLNPLFFSTSRANGISGSHQVGYGSGARTREDIHALLWSGTAASVVDLHPKGFAYSFGNGVFGNQQVGSASKYDLYGWPYQYGHTYAFLWNGSATSAVNLHPAGADSSEAFGTSGTQQVGRAAGPWSDSYWHAFLWKGTSESAIDLNPEAFLFSTALGTTGSRQVGYGGRGKSHALLWSGSPDSAVDLHPEGYSASAALGMSATHQVGFGVTGTESHDHALLWSGTPSSVIDLHLFLPPEYSDSRAQGVDEEGNVFGSARYVRSGTYHPILWSYIPCDITCPTNAFLSNDAGNCGAFVSLQLPTLTDCEGYTVSCSPPSGSFFPVGTNVVTCAVLNAAKNVTLTCSFQVVVQDREAPIVYNVSATPSVLWPPNGRMREITVTGVAADNCGLAQMRIVSVSSNEPEKDRAGQAGPDWEITGDLTVRLRAERAGSAAERVYKINLECTDDSGNTSQAYTEIVVPHSLGH